MGRLECRLVRHKFYISKESVLGKLIVSIQDFAPFRV